MRTSRGGMFMAGDDFPAPGEGFVLTHFIVAEDVARSRDFYVGVWSCPAFVDTLAMRRVLVMDAGARSRRV